MRGGFRGFNAGMPGRVGSVRDRGSVAVQYVGLGVLGAGAVLGLQQAGYVDAIAGQVRSGMCGVMRSAHCPAHIPAGPLRPGTVRHGTGAQPTDSGWSGAGQRPQEVTHLPPLPLMAGGAGLFILFWWGIPGRLRRRFERRKPAHQHLAARTRVREPAERTEAVDAAGPETDGPGPRSEVVIAGIDPGIAAKGMRVGVRDCQITLRPGPAHTVVLDKTLAGTSERAFAQASRTVRRSLRDPGFVATLIERTGRAATYLEGNPQLPGAAARREELTALVGALEGAGHGSSR